MDFSCNVSSTEYQIQIASDYIGDEEEIADHGDPVEKIINEFYQKMILHIIKEWKTLGDIRAEITFKNGNKYVGEVQDNKLQGEGFFIWTNGTVYEGMFERNYPEGFGKLTNANNENYEGFFLRGIKHGKGKLNGSNFIYDGYFENGFFHGKGRFMSSGFCFEGEFMNNKVIEGIARYPNGTFIGKFDENEERKFGKFFFNNTKDVYSGQWKNDRYHNFGKYQWYTPNNSNPFINFPQDYYIGYWHLGQPNNVGIIKFQGRTTMCVWKIGKKHGAGFIIAANGEIFVSDKLFLNNQFSDCSLLLSETKKPHLKLIYKIKKLLKVENDNLSNDVLRMSKDQCFAFEKGLHSFEKMPLCNEIFKDGIKFLMKFTSKYPPAEVFPIFIIEFNFTSKFFILEAIKEHFILYTNPEKWYLFEMKCLNKAIEENLLELYEIYLEYTKVCGIIEKEYEKQVCMPRLGLWLLYWDVLRNFPEINISQSIAMVELHNRIFVEKSRSATESVYFWHFLRHILHIISLLSCSNHVIASDMFDDTSENFGYLGIMLISFLREFRSIERFSNGKIVNMLKKNSLGLVLKLFEITEYLEDEILTFRSIYRFINEYRNKLHFVTNVTDEDFFRLASKVFLNLSCTNCVQMTPFEITPLEFWEVILLCVEYDVLQQKIEMEEKMKKNTSAMKIIGKGKKTIK